MQPIVLGNFIRTYTKDDKQNLTVDLYINGITFVALSFVSVIFYHHSNFQFSLIGMRCRIAVSSLVYRKVRLKYNTIEIVYKLFKIVKCFTF